MVEFGDSEARSNEATKPFRFGTSHLLYGTALIASGLVVAGPCSWLISALVLVIWGLFQKRVGFTNVLFCLAILGVLVGMLLPEVNSIRSTPHWMACLNNKRQCMLGLHYFESANRHFPAAYSLDADGKPMHSWRVRILPFVEHGALYDLYDFNEPWDGPNNSKLANQMPSVYRCSSIPYSDSETPYKLVTDPGAFFDEGKRPKLEDAIDGSSSTIVLIEDTEHPVNWMKPEGVSIEYAVEQIRNLNGCCRSRQESIFKTTIWGASAFSLDGSSQFISPNTDSEILLRALKSDDGHSPDVSKLVGPYVVHKPQGYIALAVYLCLLALPGWLRRKQRKRTL